MRSNQKINVLAIIVLTPFLFRCAALQEMARIQKPTVSVQRLRITDLSFSDVNLALDLSIRNPNSVAIPLAAFDYDLKINQHEFINGKKESSLNIPAGGSENLSIPFHFTFAELYKTLSGLKNQDSTAYEIHCGFSFHVPVIGPVRVPVRKLGTLPIPKLPEIRVESLRLKKLGLTGADLVLVLDVKNANAFDVNLNALDYQFGVMGKSWLKGQSGNPVILTKKEGGRIELPVSINFLEIGAAAVKILKGDGALDYRLNGSANIKPELPMMQETSLPFDMDGSVKIEK